jgi:hypothetical protein
MERDLAGAALTSQDFQRLARASRDDSKFPKTYEAWQSLVGTGTAAVLSEGLQVQVIGVVVDDFLAWCVRVQVVPCLDALRAYMILLRRPQNAGEIDATDTTAHSSVRRKGRPSGQNALFRVDWVARRNTPPPRQSSP